MPFNLEPVDLIQYSISGQLLFKTIYAKCLINTYVGESSRLNGEYTRLHYCSKRVRTPLKLLHLLLN